MSHETETTKQWEKPQLIVMVRGKPEEAVLSACKNTTIDTGYNHMNSRCMYPHTCGVWCLALQTS